MRFPTDLADWAQRKFAAGHRTWLAHARTDSEPDLTLRFPTDPPSESIVAKGPARAAAWVQSWAEFERAAPRGVDVEWALRRWRGFGEQRLPVRITLRSPSAVAAVAGQARAWQSLTDRADLLRGAWPEHDGLPAALPGIAAKLGRLSLDNLPRLIAVVNWFLANPESGVLARQVPVEGVDTKWLERHTDLVRRLVAALTGSADLGLRAEPRRFRVRLLDGGELPDFTAATADLATLDLNAGCVLLVENRDSMAPLADLPGVVAVHAQGLAAPELAVVPWIANSRILYWGDLDTHGLRILGLVRQVLPHTESVLMDRATLDRFSALAVSEPTPFRGEIRYLTPDEAAVLRVIRANDLRLEQERIPWPHVIDTISARV
ncbi:MAG: DUF3322 domain-containing protein [Propionicimonas sp.]